MVVRFFAATRFLAVLIFATGFLEVFLAFIAGLLEVLAAATRFLEAAGRFLAADFFAATGLRFAAVFLAPDALAAFLTVLDLAALPALLLTFATFFRTVLRLAKEAFVDITNYLPFFG